MGAWTIDDEGNFTLAPSYELNLKEAKEAGIEARERAMMLFADEKLQAGEPTIDTQEIARVGSKAWEEAVYDYIIDFAPVEYDYETLHTELLRRVANEGVDPTALIDGLMIDALEGAI